MDITYQRSLRIAIVTTRNVSERNGRTPILSYIVQALEARHETELLHLPALVESRSLRDVAGALLVWIASIIRARPLPPQCVLYDSPRQWNFSIDDVYSRSAYLSQQWVNFCCSRSLEEQVLCKSPWSLLDAPKKDRPL